MNTDTSKNTLFGLLSSTVGKIIVIVTSLAAIFSAFKLFAGDTRLAIVVLSATVTSILVPSCLYVLFKRSEIRTATIKAGPKRRKDFVYSKSRRTAALAMLVIISILWGIGLLYKKRTPYGEISALDALTGKQINVSGFVLTAGGEPADKALVTLFLNEKATETKEAADGKFSFTSVDISRLSSDKIRIEVKWRNLESDLTVNLSKDQLNNIAIRLPPGPPPFKVDYLILEGAAIDFLVRGQIDKRWDERLGDQPTIVVNDVFNDLKDLLNRFSAPFQSESFEISNSKAKPKSKPIVDIQLATNNQNRSFFLGGVKGYSFPKSLTREEFIALLSPNEKWHLIVTPQKDRNPENVVLPNMTADSFFFWRFATADDLKTVLQDNESDFEGWKKAAEFYSYITRNYLPPDFFLFTMRPHLEEGCDSPTSVVLETRPLKLRIALLENISNDPIRIGQFSIRNNSLDRLRSRNEDSTMIAAKPLEHKVFYASEFLKPKEKLVIPIELLLANNADEKPWVMPYGTSPEVLTELSKARTINLPVQGAKPRVEVSTSVLINMIKSRAENAYSEKEFVFGASIKIESLDIDGVDYPFRPLDTSVLVMNAGITSGSCPYVLSYAAEKNLWVNEGTILYGLNAKKKESTDEKELTRFDGSVVLRERDPETSFIDKIYVRALNYDGSEMILYPKNYQLHYEDGNYLVLKQGAQKRIDFNVPPALGAKRFIIVAKGYYIPDRNRR